MSWSSRLRTARVDHADRFLVQTIADSRGGGSAGTVASRSLIVATTIRADGG
jgi:hypothetical protein